MYIFQAGSTLITAPGSSVNLINGASACDVYWQVGSSATLDTTTSFKGTILALTSIALNDGVTLAGPGAGTQRRRHDDQRHHRQLVVRGAQSNSYPKPHAQARRAPLAAATAPATDTIASTSGATTDSQSAAFLILLVAGIAFVGSLRVAAVRSRPRD